MGILIPVGCLFVITFISLWDEHRAVKKARLINAEFQALLAALYQHVGEAEFKIILNKAGFENVRVETELVHTDE